MHPRRFSIPIPIPIPIPIFLPSLFFISIPIRAIPLRQRLFFLSKILLIDLSMRRLLIISVMFTYWRSRIFDFFQFHLNRSKFNCYIFRKTIILADLLVELNFLLIFNKTFSKKMLQIMQLWDQFAVLICKKCDYVTKNNHLTCWN
jgi:hypothetical protein